jgi:general stress protein YciG
MCREQVSVIAVSDAGFTNCYEARRREQRSGSRKKGDMPGKRQKAAEAVRMEVAAAEAPKRRRGPRAGSENARRGGMAVREKYGPEFFARIGSKGGKTVRERRGAEFYASIGRMGGQTTRNTLGVEHYERIGRMGGLRARRREREAQMQKDRNG